MWDDAAFNKYFKGRNTEKVHALQNDSLFMTATRMTTTRSSAPAWRVPGTEEPGGLQSTGSHRVGHD